MGQQHIYNFQMPHFIGLEMNKWRTGHRDMDLLLLLYTFDSFALLAGKKFCIIYVGAAHTEVPTDSKYPKDSKGKQRTSTTASCGG